MYIKCKNNDKNLICRNLSIDTWITFTLYSNYTVVLDLAQAKVNSELIVKLTKSIDGVLECTYDSTSGILAASTKKMKNNIFESQIKEIINQEGYVTLSITELIYKSE